MKYLLSLSLILNAVLVYRMMNQKSTPQKRVRIQQIQNNPIFAANREEAEMMEDSVSTLTAKSAPVVDTASEDALSEKLLEISKMDEYEWNALAEKINEDRREYLDSLGLQENAIDKADQLVKKYDEEVSKIYQQESINISLADRKLIIKKEEVLLSDLKDIYGEDKYEKFKAYRTKYNDRIFESFKEGQVQGFLLMGP